MSACTVTPGTTITEDTILTAAILNQLANPEVEIPDGAIGGPQLDPASVAAALGDGASGTNYFSNPNFSASRWARGATPVACPAGTLTYRADDWWCSPAAGTVTYERVQSGPDALSLHSAQITGAASVTTVDFGQDIPAEIASGLAAAIVVSCQIYNGTAGAITPSLRIDTANAQDNFAAVTNRYSAASGTSGATSTWVRHEWLVNAASLPNMTNGARIYVRFPSGALDTGSEIVRISQMKVERGAARTAFAMPAPAAGASDAGDAATAMVKVFLDNPDFASPRWRLPSTPVACTNAADIYNAESWFANAAGSGSTATYSRDTETPGTVSACSAKITGGAGTNAVKFGQNRESHIAAACKTDMAFSIWFYNGTGSAVTPRVKLDTPSTANSFSAGSLTNRVDQAMPSCPNGEWRRLTHSFSGAGLTSFANGFRLYVEVPSGTLDSPSKFVRFAQAQLEQGTTPSDFSPVPVEDQRATVSWQHRGLRIIPTGANSIDIDFDEVVLTDDAGRTRLLRGGGDFSLSLNTSGAGGLDTGAEAANTWYYLWLISNGVTGYGMASLSATAPTMPAGYNFRALVGCAYNDGSSDIVGFEQIGRWWCRQAVTLFSSTLTTGYVAKTSTQIPPHAVRCRGTAGVVSNHDCHLYLADKDVVPAIIAQIVAASSGTLDTFYFCVSMELPISISQTLYARALNTTPTYRVDLNQFLLP